MKKLLGLVLAIFTVSTMGLSQAVSVNGGSIQGTITDSTGAVVPNAQIIILGTDTGSSKSLTTDSAGFYSVGPLNPGNYQISVTAPGFQKLAVKTVVRTGTATTGTFKLTLGQSSETIEVNAGALQVNTEQAGVSDVITAEQIKSLPVNGRNFLDLAQIEPGVILQSGESFDPTKAGYSAISVSGVSGRTTRILLDGQDITDETVGTTIFNVSQGSINEFQLNRSTQDVSGDVTSTGQVLVSTNSGTNTIHGQAFYNFQDYRELFAASRGGVTPPFQRNQFGGAVGAPILKDKLFFFGNIERIKQDSASVAPVGTLFPQILAAHGTVPSPYRETYSTVRLDANGPKGSHMFVRANYNVNSVASNFGDGYWLYANRDNTPGLAGGFDITTGKFTHSFRGSYEKFHNLISDSTAGNGSIYNGIPGFAFYFAAQGLYSGPNYLAPQGTYQSDKQARYDGTWIKGAHIVRYGYSVNRILGGGFAAFFGLSPRARISSTTLLNGNVTAGNPLGLGCNDVVGGASCPSDPVHGYHTNLTYVGNGQGYFTENSGFNLPGGGTGDWRSGAYLADGWKVTPSFTLTAGIRWSVDTGRANQDLPTPLCSDVVAANFGGTSPCTGSAPLFDTFQAGLGKKVHQPYANFAPQLGFAFSPGDHRTVLRGGAGIFYEGDVFNNTTNARNVLLKQGAFFDFKGVCGGTYTITLPGAAPNGGPQTSVDGIPLSTLCNESIANAAPHLIKLQQNYQAQTKANAVSSNGAFVGANLDVAGAYGAPYRTPYAEQFNGGIQRELFKGAILSVDYVHNSTIKIGQTTDVNHVGAARTLNVAAAQNAIATTTAGAGCSGGYSAAAINCAIASGKVSITDFAGNHLDSANAIYGGTPASYNGDTVATGAAFPGTNPALGNGNFILPTGRSGYDALQVVYRQQKSHPFTGVQSTNFQIAYTLSRIVSNTNAVGNAGDQFFPSGAFDNDNTTQYIGRNGLDRTHQVTFGGSFVLKYGPQIGVVGHFYSAVPSTLLLDQSSGAAGQIFQTDVTGDGTVGDVVPGTNPGYYMHEVKGSNLNSFIDRYNATNAGRITPAGQALINAGLFNASQLVALNATQQPIAKSPSTNALNNTAPRNFDVNFSYPIRLSRFREGLSLEPAIAFYNVFNFSNFTGYNGDLINQANAGGPITTDNQAGSLNGPNTFAIHDNQRVQRGSGTFDQGAPRSTEFQLKLNF